MKVRFQGKHSQKKIECKISAATCSATLFGSGFVGEVKASRWQGSVDKPTHRRKQVRKTRREITGGNWAILEFKTSQN